VETLGVGHPVLRGKESSQKTLTSAILPLSPPIAARQPLLFPLNHGAMRKVLKSDQGPLEIKPQEKSVWICMCGLSKNQPYCDGSHKKTRDEENGKTYEYDDEGHRQGID
jgi:CDGSH-type Zn-finger protein